jgi:hypothetical protein
MPRKSKREIQRDVKDLEVETDEPEIGPVFVLETQDGEYLTPDGEPLEDSTVGCFTIPPGVWEEWERI